MEVWKAWNRQFSTSKSTQISLYLQIVKISRSMMGVFVCVSGSFVVKGKDLCGFLNLKKSRLWGKYMDRRI